MKKLILGITIVASGLTNGTACAQSSPLPECEWCGAAEAPDNLASTITLADENEPGERLLLQGTVYAPDGITVDTQPWREADTLNGNGYVETFPTKGPFEPPNPARPRSFRRLNRADIQKVFPYPIANYYVVLTDSAESSHVPPRVEAPPLDEGNHRNYAIQWFSFAVISIVGLVIFLRRT